MPVLKTSCHWKAVTFLAGGSVAASLLRVIMKGTTVQTYFCWLLPFILILHSEVLIDLSNVSCCTKSLHWF